MRTRNRTYSIIETRASLQARTPSADKSTQVREICLYDYHATGMPGYGPSSVINPLASQYVERLEQLCAEQDQDAFKIQGALRWLSGTETQGRPCEEGALHFLDPIINRKIDIEAELRTIEDYPLTTHEALSCLAHSIAAYIYFRKYMASAEDLRAVVDDSRIRFPRGQYQTRVDDQWENMSHAARHATHAAAGGFVSPAVLMVGFALNTLVEHVSVDMSLSLQDMKQYRPLWRAIERWTRELFDVKSRGLGKQHQAPPPSNQCSAANCAAVNVCRQSGPRPRSCKCSVEVAPRYCSKECQDQDWTRHQATCMSGGVFTPPAIIMARHERVYDDLIVMSALGNPVVRVEVMEEDENREDPMNGEVLVLFELPCPFGTPGKEVLYALKHYQ